jgi:hypothetical protein
MNNALFPWVTCRAPAVRGQLAEQLVGQALDKKLRFAVRIDENPPSLAAIDVATTQGDPVRYRLLSLPIYLAWRAAELAALVR